jgi:hypothetical protein
MDITEISGTKADLENMVERVARGLRFVMYGVPSDRPLDSSSPWFLRHQGLNTSVKAAMTSETAVNTPKAIEIRTLQSRCSSDFQLSISRIGLPLDEGATMRRTG